MDPVINIEDSVGKVVGQRSKMTKQGYVAYAMSLQSGLNGFPRPRHPKGVFRFHSHEEADQWLMNHLTRKRES